MVLGLYKHRSGGWYIALCGWIWESTNGEARRPKVLYISLRNLVRLKLKEVLNVRWRAEFYEIEQTPRGRRERFRRIFPPWQP